MFPRHDGSRVAVGIVTFNSRHDIPTALDAVRLQSYAPIEVTILDNGSADGTHEWLMSNAGDCRILRNETNVGFSRGQNAILQTCDLRPGDFFMALNPDAVISPNYVAELVRCLNAQSAGWGTGKLVAAAREATTRTLYSIGHALKRDGYAFNIGYGMPDDGSLDQAREVFGAPGAACVMSGEFVRELAPQGELFDADFFLYGEDTDLDWRGRLMGFHCIYVPTAEAFHRGSEPKGKLRDDAIANRYLSVLKNAFLIDLITHNLPIIFAHVLLRSIVSPRSGTGILVAILRLAPRMWAKRSRPKISRDYMVKWFHWSDGQATRQAKSVFSRIRAYRERSLTDERPP
jgi:GT2 family glycosyltransferase